MENLHVSICKCACSPAGVSRRSLECGRIAYEFVQHVDDLAEFGSIRSFPHPALQHELMQSQRTLHGRRQPVAFLYCLYHLGNRGEEMKD